MSFNPLQKTLWALAVAGVVAFGSLLLWVEYRGVTGRTVQETTFRADFELTDHRGVVRTDEDFAGRWLLVFFGFSNFRQRCRKLLRLWTVLAPQ